MSVKISMEKFLTTLLRLGVSKRILLDALRKMDISEDIIQKISESMGGIHDYKKPEKVESRVGKNAIHFEQEVMSMSFDLVKLKGNYAAIKARIEGLDKRLTTLEAKFEALLRIVMEYAPVLFKEWEKNVSEKAL